MAHKLEAAKSGRAACATCGEVIAKGEVRAAELYQDSELGPQRVRERYERRERGEREPIYRFHHLACAVQAVPAVVRSALAAPHDRALVPDRDALDAALALALETERKKRVEAATARLLPIAAAPSAADAHLEPLLAQLAEAPEDATTLTVVGDLFTARGDAQGELISVQLALRTAKVERAPEVIGARTSARDREIVDSTTATLIARRDELMRQLAPRLDPADRSSWGTGFVRRLELGEKSSVRLLELAGLWKHPALPVLQELALDLPPSCDGAAILAHLREALPRSLRRLEIAGAAADRQPLARLVAALPRLVRLALIHRAAGPELAHPGLVELALVGSPYADTIQTLSCAALPAVRSLVFRAWIPSSDPLAALARSAWLAQLERVHLDEPARFAGSEPELLTNTSAEALRAGLAGKKLARLEVTGMSVPLPVRAILAACCTELVCPMTAVVLDASTTHVEHSAKPEWGRGRIVKFHDGKLEVKFPKIGVKVFRADAPFLKPVT